MRLQLLSVGCASAALLASQHRHDQDKSKVDQRLKQTKGLYELVRQGSSSEDRAAFDKKYSEIREKTDAKTRTMTEEEAVTELKKLNPEAHAVVTSALVQNEAVARENRTEKATQYVSAMGALNKMYLAAEDARITTMTECKVNLFQRFNQLAIYSDTIKNFELEIAEAWSAAYLANQQKEKAESDLELKNQEANELAGRQSTEMGAEQEMLAGMEAETSTFRFIMNQVEEQCPTIRGNRKQAKFTKRHEKAEAEANAGLLATKAERARERCLAEEPAQASMNSALLKIFSSPGVMDAADKELDATSAKSLKDLVANVEAAEREEIHAVYKGEFKQATSFLQKAQQPGADAATAKAPPPPGGAPSRDPLGEGGLESSGLRSMGITSSSGAADFFSNYQGCGCGGDGLDCNALFVIVGQELECRKNKQATQEGVINALEKEHQKQTDDMNAQILALNKLKEMFETQIENYNNEAKSYHEPKWKNILDMEELYHGTADMRMNCYLQLMELEQNEYCAIKKLRDHMKGVSLAWAGLEDEPDTIQDCVYEDELTPQGYCFAANDKSEHLECLPGDKVPAKEDELPKQQYVRKGPTNAEFSSDGLLAAFNNQTIAMGCPLTKTMHLTCNAFLCPKDCSVSDFSAWSQCTAECDKGATSRDREVVHMPLNGGASCPPLQESKPCNPQPCNRKCELHEDFIDEATIDGHSGCLQACRGTDDFGEPESARYKMMIKPIFKKAIGNGGCYDVEEEGVRTQAEECDDHGEDRRCKGDEVCADKMDLVIAYECSASTTKLGCWFMAQFVVALLEKMPTFVGFMGTMQVGLVMFGNGISKTMDRGETYYVNPAKRVSPLTTEIGRKELRWNDQTETLETVSLGGLSKRVLNHIIKVFHGRTNYNLGFTNVGSAVRMASDILDRSTRSGNSRSDITAKQKILLITKGKRAECTPIVSVTDAMKKKGVSIDVILFSQSYHESPNEAERTIQQAATYPYRFHIHNPGTLSKLNDATFRSSEAARLIPKICPGAFSPAREIGLECNKGYAVVHRGRTCHDWTYPLSKNPVSLEKCRNLANDKGFKGFIHTDLWYMSGNTGANCFSHMIYGKMRQVNEKDEPSDDTCQYVPDYAPKGNETAMEDYKGWSGQAIPAGNGDATTHYRVLSGKCGGVHLKLMTWLMTSYSATAWKWWFFRPRHGDL